MRSSKPLFRRVASGVAGLAAVTASICAMVPAAGATPARVVASVASGEAMPVGDLPGWRQVFADDFATDVPLGSFPAAVSSRWGAYPSPWKDTSKYGTYSPTRVVSIGGGVLNSHIHTENGVSMVSALTPKLPSPMTYGRYAVRYRFDSMPGYKVAWMLWPDSGGNQRNGEIDFPEMNLDSSNVWAFNHRTNSTGSNDQAWFKAALTPGTWHTSVIEWSPNLVVFLLDGKELGRTTERVPSTPMHWVLQTETALTTHAPADPNVSGNVQVDWAAAWRYDPSAAGGASVADGGAAGTVASAVTTAVGSAMQPVAPVRVVDTRIGRGGQPFAAGGQQRLQVAGLGGVPAGATAVVANVTATEAAADGFVTLWNCAGGRPTASTLNFRADQNVPNSATIPLDAGGGICAFAYAATQLIVDVTGYDAPGAPGRYNPVPPTRIMDSRIPLGPTGRLAAGQTVELPVAGAGGVPAAPTAVVLNVTAADAGALGFVTAFPCGDRPETSNLNPAVGDNRANLVTTTLSATGTVCLFTLQPTDLVVDVVGYFAPTGRQLAVTTPFRFTDTREPNPQLNAERNGRQLAAGVVTEIPMAGVRGISAGATAVSVNITATGASGPGWVAAWPCTGSAPTTSNVNYGPLHPVANAAQLTLSSRGTICVVSYTDVDVIIDVNGWWA